MTGPQPYRGSFKGGEHLRFGVPTARRDTSADSSAAASTQSQTSNQHQKEPTMSVSTPVAMPSGVTIELSTPVEWFSKIIREVVVAGPSARDYFELGDPLISVWHEQSAAGSRVEVPAVLSAYVDKCVQVEQASVFLAKCSLIDGKKIKKAILGFFREPAEASSS